jgi:tRNA A58 N-methylase Trm61
MTEMILKHNIEIGGKRILDISGGNGYFAKMLGKYGAKIAMTEYNEKSVEYARNIFQIEAVKFDFNQDCISSLFKGTFDLVLLRAAIMFCLNPRKFLDDLKEIIHKDTLIIVYDSVLPTLGAFLRWQLDDYTYLILYRPETLEKVFEKQGFGLVFREKHTPYAYNLGWGMLGGLLGLIYEIPARLKYKNRDRVQKSSSFIFKLMP